MARKSIKKVTDPAVDRVKLNDFRDVTWVLNNLTRDEVGQADEQVFDGERFADFIERCVDNGLDVKFSWDSYSETYQVSAVGGWQGFHNAGFAVSARGLDIFDASKLLWFKLEFVAGFDLPAFKDKVETRGKRG